MARSLIALGANLGDRQATITAALDQLAQHDAIAVVARSSLFETAPVGGPTGQQSFINAAALLETSLSPAQLHGQLVEVERTLGRERGERWGARKIDLDLLLHDDEVITTPDLVVPHPRMSFRRFVLDPAAEVAPDMVHPVIGWTLAQLRDHIHEHAPYIAISGPIGVGKSYMAERLSKELDAALIAENVSAERLEPFYADTTGLAWETEIKFLTDRAGALGADALQGRLSTGGASLAVSDYWFDQSLAFARVWLPEDRQAEYEQKWEAARKNVLPPKLLVFLESPVEKLLDAIQHRGRAYEMDLAAETIERLGQSVRDLIGQGGHGPLLVLDGTDIERADIEIRAAIEAMEPY